MKRYAVYLLALSLLSAAAPDERRFGPNDAFQLEYNKDSFGVRSHGVIERLDSSGRTKLYPLPQSTLESYIKLRPADIKMNPIAATAGRYERQEVIGSHQVEGDKLWFGNSFYDGEGDRGVGAFGYFDMKTRQYQLFSPPEVAPYEISDILVEPNVVWLGLDHFGEDISTSPGGLAEWNRTTHEVRRYPLEFDVYKIATDGDSLRLTTADGYALLKNGVVRRFETRVTAKGTVLTPVDRFPPPPSHY